MDVDYVALLSRHAECTSHRAADQNEDADDVKMSPAMEEAVRTAYKPACLHGPSTLSALHLLFFTVNRQLNAIQEDDSVQGFFDHKGDLRTAILASLLWI